MNLIVRSLRPGDRDAALFVINTSARWYREFLPDTEYHEPEMTVEAWNDESKRIIWYGAFKEDHLLGVMGLEYVGEVALLRHAYVEPKNQRQGISTLLMEYLETEIRGTRRIVVGTYARNYKARAALKAAGYSPSANSESVLRAYYSIPEDRLSSSVTYEKELRQTDYPLTSDNSRPGKKEPR